MRAEELQKQDLIPGRIYEHDKPRPNTLSALMQTKDEYKSTPVMSGFRVSTVEKDFRAVPSQRAFIAITSGDVKGRDKSWKDDIVDDRLVYFGDNVDNADPSKSKGNSRLVDIFAAKRLLTKDVYPVFFFKMFGKRKYQYIGICYPLVDGLSIIEQNGVPNFKAEFTVDQDSVVTKKWLTALKEGRWADSDGAPGSWQAYLEDGAEGARQYIEAQFNEYSTELEHIGSTTTVRETSVRLTQEKFRQRLLARQHSCLICGIANDALLIASHIKPWADSNDDERMDPANGLILCALHDRLFDRHFITFDAEGRLMISNALSEADARQSGLLAGTRYEGLDAHQKYLKYHREAFDWKEEHVTN